MDKELTSESEIIILLDNSFNLEKLKKIILIKNPFKIISFDYSSHKLLKENLIPHIPSESFLQSSDFEKLQRLSHQFSNWSLNDPISQKLEFEGINLGHLFYRDFQHSLLPILKIYYEIFKITKSLKNSSFITSSSLFQYVKLFSNNILPIRVLLPSSTLPHVINLNVFWLFNDIRNILEVSLAP